jgi:hypothetical protein
MNNIHTSYGDDARIRANFLSCLFSLGLIDTKICTVRTQYRSGSIELRAWT